MSDKSSIFSFRITAIAMLLSTTLHAQEQRLEMEGTAIRGNKELPRVLYIVPWKPAQPIEIPTPPIASILDRPLQTIERKSFRRRVQYYQSIFPDSVKR